MTLSSIGIMISGERTSFAFLIMTSVYLGIMLQINTKHLLMSVFVFVPTILLFIYSNSSVKYRLIDFKKEQINLTNEENSLYFFIWFLVVVITCIIFLNFIIAEASASYQNVKDNLEALINKERASLVSEAE